MQGHSTPPSPHPRTAYRPPGSPAQTHASRAARASWGPAHGTPRSLHVFLISSASHHGCWFSHAARPLSSHCLPLHPALHACPRKRVPLSWWDQVQLPCGLEKAWQRHSLGRGGTGDKVKSRWREHLVWGGWHFIKDRLDCLGSNIL